MIGTLLDPHDFLRPGEAGDTPAFRRRALAQLVGLLAGGLRAEAAQLAADAEGATRS